jgi:hypothetical protein
MVWLREIAQKNALPPAKHAILKEGSHTPTAVHAWEQQEGPSDLPRQPVLDDICYEIPYHRDCRPLEPLRISHNRKIRRSERQVVLDCEMPDAKRMSRPLIYEVATQCDETIMEDRDVQSRANPPGKNISITADRGVAGIQRRWLRPFPCTPSMI